MLLFTYKSMVFEEVNKKDFILNILVACEESQEVCKAFRNKGHNAFRVHGWDEIYELIDKLEDF